MKIVSRNTQRRETLELKGLYQRMYGGSDIETIIYFKNKEKCSSPFVS